MRCLLIGNYGVQNFGDEALKDYFLQTFPDVSWSVLSAFPQRGEYARFPTGIRSIFSAWPKTLRALKDCDAVVFGGGSLFTDSESIRACWIWFFHAWIAHHYRKPILLAFQGIGPFRTKLGERLALWVSRRSAFISVRDEESTIRCETWNLNRKVIQSFDPFYKVIFDQNVIRSQKVFVVIPRQNSDDSFINHALDVRKQHPAMPVRILSLEPDSLQEQSVSHRIAALCSTNDIRPIRTTADLVSGLSDAATVVTQRYHGAIAALALGVPFDTVSQQPGDKLNALAAIAGTIGRDALRRRVDTGEEALREALRCSERKNPV